MKKLSKEHLKTRDELVARFTETRSSLEAAILTFNDLINEHWSKVQARLNDFNEVVGEAKEWIRDIAGEIEEFTSGRSTHWQESATGQKYAEWRDLFESIQVEIDQVDLLAPDEVAFDDVGDYGQLLLDLSEKP